MTASTHRRTILIVLALALGLLTPPASGAEFHELGCVADPTGDAGGLAIADLDEICVRVQEDRPSAPVGEQGGVEVFISSDGGIDPTTHAGWGNDDTTVAVALSIDGDDSGFEVTASLRPAGTGFAIEGVGPNGEDLDTTCPNFGFDLLTGDILLFRVARSCLGDPDDVSAAAVYSYQAAEGEAVTNDRAPDGSAFTPPRATGDSPPFCDNHAETGEEVTVARIRCGGVFTGTEPISQAVAVSQFVFDDRSTSVIEPYLGSWAVIVRDDNFADALAGSSLGFGQGPLLFTYSPTSGPALGQDHTRLAAATTQELLRTVPRGRNVYVLGGTAAIDAGVEDHLRELGYVPVRLAGPSREGTAAAVARETRRLVVEYAEDHPEFHDTNMVLIANRDNWPDAVLAGQVGAFWGMPILLTSATGPGHPETMAALMEIRPQAINFIGGSGVITSETLNLIRDEVLDAGFGMGAPGETQVTDDTSVPWRPFCARRDAEGNITEPFWVCRQGGRTRLETGAAVSQFGREMALRFGADIFGEENRDLFVSGVPLAGGTASDNFAYVLAASMMSGRFGGAVFLPTDNGTLSDAVIASVCDLRRGVDTNDDGTLDTPFIELIELVALMSDTDKLPDSFGEEVRSLIQDGCPPEFTSTSSSFASAN